ncbi:alpha/beta hydrolase [Levilactobacillus bambusae]|uniref:Alpha/beta hydrolase n=1 Tax=Levilactobacillus bambusae TaxID=2024736 RepID=A0A2V1N1U1_9LACO|nr:alpha/beta hydrolase [Levilactobacillus bambusae]PWG00306.1 alpha/beta hydrolase [Levilactobacillus bambusae]
MKQRKWWIGLVVLIVAMVSAICFQLGRRESNSVQPSADGVPTFYLHGYGGSANSTNGMIDYAVQHNGATKVIQAVVAPNGKVTLRGRWTGQVTHPIVQVVYQNPRQRNFKTDGRWFRNVLLAVKKQHSFSRFNAVAHSMGNMSLMYETLFDSHESGMPQLQKEVNIAGHFDGIVQLDDRPNQNSLAANGKPKIMDSTYRELLANQNQFPKNQVDILNVYGNLRNGTNSDGDVTNVSSRSLYYLVGKRAKSYTELQFNGPSAQHSRLHENQRVDKAIGSYLYRRY